MADNIKIDLLINAAQSAKTIGETKKALKDLKSEALNLKEGSAAFTKIATAAGELQDKIGDLSATTKYLGDDLKNIKGITGIGEGIAGGFAMASGAAALFGGENKKLEESMVKLQAIMAVIQGMQAIGDVLQKQSAATLFIKNMMTKTAIALGYEEVAVKEAAVVVTGEEVAATVADTAAKGAKIVATEAEVVATKSATLGQKALNLAMKMNPIGILIALIIAGVSALMLWSDATGKSEEAEKKANAEKKKAADLQKKQNEEKEKAAQSIAKESTSYAMLIDKLRLTNAGSKERRDLIKQINSTYGATLKNMSDEKAFQDQLNLSVDQYIAFKKDEYKLKGNEEKYTAALKAQDKAQQDLNKAMNDAAEAGYRIEASMGIAPAKFQKPINDAKEKVKEMDKWMAALTVSTQKTSAAMKDLGFNTETSMDKGIDKTNEAIEAQRKLREAALKSQEDLIKARGEMSEQNKADLRENKRLQIDNMKEGFEKEKALLKQAAEEKIADRRASDEKEISEYRDKYEKALADRMALDKSSREKAAKEIAKEIGTQNTVVEEVAKKERARIIFENAIKKKYNDDLNAVVKAANEKNTEEYNQFSEDEIKRLYKEDLDGINDMFEKKLISQEEYNKQYSDLVEARAKVEKYWEDKKIKQSAQVFYANEFLAEPTSFDNQAAQDELNALNKLNDEKLISEEEYQVKFNEIIKKYGPPRMAIVTKEGLLGSTAVEYDTKLSFLENLVRLYKAKYGEIAEVVHDENVKSSEEQAAEDAKKLADKEKFWDEMVALEQQGQELMMSIFNDAMAQREATVNKEYDDKIAKIDEEKLAYDNLQANRTIQQQQEYDTQQGFENQKIEAQKVRDMELDKIKQKQFNAQKYNDMASIAINTALAVSKAVMAAPLTFGMPWSALLLAMGIAQEATVASKQYIPAFAKGGIFNTNGMVNGPGSGTSDSVNAKLSNGEAVINAKSTKMFAPMLSAINQAGGGKAIPHLKNGGIYTEPSMQMQGGYLDTQAIVDAIYSTNERPIETYVSESSITTAQKNKQRLKGRTSF